MAPQSLQSFAVPESFVGKSLFDLQREGQKVGRPDVLGSFLGVDPSQPLRAGQIFDFRTPPGVDPSGSAEIQFLNQAFQPGGPARAQQLQQQAQQAVQPAVQTLQSGIEPLKQRYNELIASIKGSKESAVKQAEVGAAQEFARRGLTPASGAFQPFLQSRTLPVTTQFEQLGAETGLQAQGAEQAIQGAIAQLQATAGLSGFDKAVAIENALRTLAETQRQFDITSGQTDRELALREETARQPQQQEQFTTLGEGSTLFNLLTGQPIFTAPKTFKSQLKGQVGFDESDFE